MNQLLAQTGTKGALAEQVELSGEFTTLPMREGTKARGRVGKIDELIGASIEVLKDAEAKLESTELVDLDAMNDEVQLAIAGSISNLVVAQALLPEETTATICPPRIVFANDAGDMLARGTVPGKFWKTSNAHEAYNWPDVTTALGSMSSAHFASAYAYGQAAGFTFRLAMTSLVEIEQPLRAVAG